MYTARGSPRLAVGLQGPERGPGGYDAGGVWIFDVYSVCSDPPRPLVAKPLDEQRNQYRPNSM